MKFAVVVGVPKGDRAWGNLALSHVTHVQMGNDPESCKAIADVGGTLPALTVALRSPVFILGELLVLDSEHGREVAGNMRKPSKWDVEIEHFDDVQVAAARAREVTRENLNGTPST